MSIFQVKPMRVETPEEGFDLPTSAIIRDRRVGFGLGDQDDILLREPDPDKIHGQSPYATGRMEETFHTERGIPKKAGGGMMTCASAKGNVGIVPNPETKGNVMSVKKLKPQRTNTLPICCQAADAFCSELAQKPPHQPDTFTGIGIPAFIEE